MAKKGKKKARKSASGPQKIRDFSLGTVQGVIDGLKKRKAVVDRVAEALRTGGTAVDTPGFLDKSPLQQATHVSRRLQKAIDALNESCPNDLATPFVIDLSYVETAKKGKRSPR